MSWYFTTLSRWAAVKMAKTKWRLLNAVNVITSSKQCVRRPTVAPNWTAGMEEWIPIRVCLPIIIHFSAYEPVDHLGVAAMGTHKQVQGDARVHLLDSEWKKFASSYHCRLFCSNQYRISSWLSTSNRKCCSYIPRFASPCKKILYECSGWQPLSNCRQSDFNVTYHYHSIFVLAESSQLSLLPSVGREMSTSQSAATLRLQGLKASMVHFICGQT